SLWMVLKLCKESLVLCDFRFSRHMELQRGYHQIIPALSNMTSPGIPRNSKNAFYLQLTNLMKVLTLS
ncbi:hypothetical protein MKW92_038226, partial [Papaver armeniacum]